jgi:hypothetical protein
MLDRRGTRYDERGLASDLLHNRDGALAHERDRHRMALHAPARDAAGGAGGVCSQRESPPVVQPFN